MTYDPPLAHGLSGDELFAGLDAYVSDFWRFAMNDLRTNNVRGYLAEFLVTRAVGSTDARVEWAPWDVTAPDGTRIEVKSSGFLQSWRQNKLSRPTFRVAPALAWHEPTGIRSVERQFNADAYVFGLHTATTHDEYDPLAVSQWMFYVAGRAAIELQAGAAMGLSTLARVAGDPVTYSGLHEAINTAATASRLSRPS